MRKTRTHEKIKTSVLWRLAALLVLSLASCTEEIDLGDTVEFEDLLVVDANITDEFKQQAVYLSRSFRFDQEQAEPESSASVSLVADGQNVISFYEQAPGQYLSEEAFAPQPGVAYELLILDSKGISYSSDQEMLPEVTPIENVYATGEVNSLGNQIIAINVDSYDPGGNSKYYRYEYEETYQIIAPHWIYLDFVLLPGPEPGFTLRGEDQRVCYRSDRSRDIIQTSTVKLKEDRVSKFKVRSIAIDDPIIRSRYSILVKQYVQSNGAYTYYNILDQMSGRDDLFATIQPGQLDGNIHAENEDKEKVLGYFELSSVSEKRIFVEFRDLYPNESSPPYFTDCPTSAPPITDMGATPLRDAIEGGQIKYFGPNTSPGPFEGPHKIVTSACGDCRVLGSSDKPDFWEDR